MITKKYNFLGKARGFTLVEIMIVVTIIGILASLAVPAFQRARWKAVETSIRNNLRQIWGAAQQYMLENGVDQVDFTTIVAWQKKDGTATGTNQGYTSVIKQVSTEDYDTVVSYLGGDTDDAITDSETVADDPKGTAKYMYENTIGLRIAVNSSAESGTTRYVKLKN